MTQPPNLVADVLRIVYADLLDSIWAAMDDPTSKGAMNRLYEELTKRKLRVNAASAQTAAGAAAWVCAHGAPVGEKCIHCDLSTPPSPTTAGVDVTAPTDEPPNWPTQSFDGRDWALAFIKRVKSGLDPTDEGWMIGWFCNAIMRGWDEKERRIAAKSVGKLLVPVEYLKATLGSEKEWQAFLGGLEFINRETPGPAQPGREPATVAPVVQAAGEASGSPRDDGDRTRDTIASPVPTAVTGELRAWTADEIRRQAASLDYIHQNANLSESQQASLAYAESMLRDFANTRARTPAADGAGGWSEIMARPGIDQREPRALLVRMTAAHYEFADLPDGHYVGGRLQSTGGAKP